MYIALFRLNQEKILLGRRVPWRFWTVASLEGHYTYDWHSSHDVARGKVDASCGQFQYFYRELYKGIERASTFIANVDNCLEIPETERVNMRGQARALRAYYYFY